MTREKEKKLKAAVPFDEAMAILYRKNPTLAVEILNECIKEGDQEMLLVTLGHIIKTFGSVARLAKETSLNENTLHRTLSHHGNPTMKTLFSIMDAMGMRLVIVPKTQKHVEIDDFVPPVSVSPDPHHAGA